MSIFSKVAMPRPQHNTFDLSHSRKFSMSIGKITPTAINGMRTRRQFQYKNNTTIKIRTINSPNNASIINVLSFLLCTKQITMG